MPAVFGTRTGRSTLGLESSYENRCRWFTCILIWWSRSYGGHDTLNLAPRTSPARPAASSGKRKRSDTADTAPAAWCSKPGGAYSETGEVRQSLLDLNPWLVRRVRDDLRRAYAEAEEKAESEWAQACKEGRQGPDLEDYLVLLRYFINAIGIARPTPLSLRKGEGQGEGGTPQRCTLTRPAGSGPTSPCKGEAPESPPCTSTKLGHA